MNLRRYGRVAIAVAVVVGIVAYLFVLLGAQPNSVRPSGGLTVPGNTVTFAAVDHSGQFGTITVTRRGERPVTADELQWLAGTGGAMTVVEVEIAYAPQRPSDSGFGIFDWQVWVDGTFYPGGSPSLFMPITSAGQTTNEVAGHADPRVGILGVPIPPSAAGKAVFLVYTPGFLPCCDNPFERKSTTRVQVWGP